MTICAQNLRILLSSFGEKNSQMSASNFSMFKLSLAINSPTV